MSKTKLRPLQNRDEAAEWVGRKVVNTEIGDTFLVTRASHDTVTIGGNVFQFVFALERFNIGVEVPIEERWRDCTIADLVNGPVEGRVRCGASDWEEHKITGFDWGYDTYKWSTACDSWEYAQVRDEQTKGTE